MIGFVKLENTTAECIYMSIKDCLLHLAIPFEKFRGQAYDGASNIQGRVKGVAKRFLMIIQQQFRSTV